MPMLAFLFQHRCSLSAKCACTSLPRDSSFPPSCCLCPAAEQPRVLTNERPLVFALVLVFVCLWFTLASALAQSHRARNVGVRARRHDARDARPTSGASRGSVPAGSLVAVMHIERRGVHVLASVPQVCLGCSSERLLRCVRHAVPCAVCLAWCARAVEDVRVCAREKDSTHRLRWYFGGRLGVGICWLSSRTMVRGRLGVGLEAVEKEGPVWQSRAGSLIPSRGRRRIFGVVALYSSCRLFLSPSGNVLALTGRELSNPK